ncbi:MAG: transglycosylase [Gallionellales bacterium 35-53-114]|jgi:membrane-bound lytic murein transglycosylase A|nr:MAG: transglycosylase [Gallionellales bacterium 35-53-114]OYZ64543.1 MAG: transglycosylase [Gallionellales bacterium 24-53-125]OZB10150.1 MAG: transglycosylase [Gallionellales bacterium 39-52-133]HQS56735.1 MltA domain-containing protein [Gallionellaceae bacterium]HQS75481.1 MltA domain-containing protein [Gallionellaceae bacterium]
MRKQAGWLGLIGAGMLLAACQTAPVVKPTVKVIPQPVVATTPPLPATPLFTPSTWEVLPEWSTLDLRPSWAALLQSCRVLKNKPQWQGVCASTELVDKNDSQAQRRFYEDKLAPFQIFNPDGTENGVITGYYEPLLRGSRFKSERFRYPLYAAPDDMLEIDLGDAYPQLKGQRLRGRLSGKKVVPYFKRAEIDAGTDALRGRELFWVENAVELFFLQIQGSGRIELVDGRQIKVGYADQNGHPYVSIGRKLVEMGEMKLEEASMQSIKAWGERNPTKLMTLLEMNPSYVFFRELPEHLTAPLGALGVPLTNEYSIAVDPKSIPLGSPVFLATTHPNTATPLNRLMLAQDTGGAIRGSVRADFFWGFGEKAGAQAGRMKQQGRMWVLFPKGGEPVQF